MIRRHKFAAERSGGFASKLEAAVHATLQLLERAGEIKSIQIQDHVRLSKAEILYIPDFRVELPDGAVEWHEAKGFETPEWKIKKRLWKAYGPGPLTVWKGSHAKPYIHERIVPDAVDPV